MPQASLRMERSAGSTLAPGCEQRYFRRSRRCCDGFQEDPADDVCRYRSSVDRKSKENRFRLYISGLWRAGSCPNGEVRPPAADLELRCYEACQRSLAQRGRRNLSRKSLDFPFPKRRWSAGHTRRDPRFHHAPRLTAREELHGSR